MDELSYLLQKEIEVDKEEVAKSVRFLIESKCIFIKLLVGIRSSLYIHNLIFRIFFAMIIFNVATF